MLKFDRVYYVNIAVVERKVHLRSMNDFFTGKAFRGF